MVRRQAAVAVGVGLAWLATALVGIGAGPPAASAAPGDIGARYVSLTPCRVVDTRSTAAGPVTNRTFRVTGTGSEFAAQGGRSGGCGVPDGAIAVEASVTATAPTGAGYVRLWSASTTEPGSTFLNFEAQRSITNTGTLAVATTAGPGDLSARVQGTPVHLVIDVQGYYAAGATGATFVPIIPCRVADTRGRGALVPQEGPRQFQVAGTGARFATQGGKAGGCAIPAAAVAVEATVTALDHPRAGYLRVWAAGSPAPGATFLNHSPGRSITNTGTVPVATTAGADDLSVAAFGGSTDVVVDVQGYFTLGTGGATYVPVQPCRAFDTRTQSSRLTAGEQQLVPIETTDSIEPPCPVPTTAVAAEATLTAVAPQGAGFLRAWPSDRPAPNATFLNYASGGSITNTGTIATAELQQDVDPPDLTVRNFGGATDLVVDVQGYFQLPNAVLPGALVEDQLYRSGTGRLSADGSHLVGAVAAQGTVVLDRATRVSTVVGPAPDTGHMIAISADGNHVAIGTADIEVHDVAAGTTQTLAGVEPSTLSISADGEHVVYESFKPLAGDSADDNAQDDVFVWDLADDEVTRITDNADWPDPGPIPADWIESMRPVISADGSAVAYESLYIGAPTPPQSPGRRVFVWDRATNLTTPVAVGGTGAYDPIGGLGFQVEGPMRPSISDDGQRVAYLSAGGLPAGPTEGDAYVWSRATATSTRVTSTGLTTGSAVLSGDGGTLAFASRSGAVVPGDRNERADVFRLDLASSTVERLTEAGLESNVAVVGTTTDGQQVAFVQDAGAHLRVWSAP